MSFRRIILVACMLVAALGRGQQTAPEVRMAIPTAAEWRYIATDSTAESRPIISIEAVCGEKWRVEVGNTNKQMVYVFDGKSFASTFPGAKKEGIDPIVVLRAIQRDVSRPTKTELIERAGRRYISYYLKDSQSESTVLIDPNTKFLMKFTGTGKNETRSVVYEYFNYDIKAHEGELFDVNNLQAYFKEYPPKPAKGVTSPKK